MAYQGKPPETQREHLVESFKTNIFVMLVFVVVGLMMALAVRYFGSQDIEPVRTFYNVQSLHDQELEIDNAEIRNQALSKRLEATQGTLSVYQEAAQNSVEGDDLATVITAQQNTEILSLNLVNGDIAVQGPGVQVTIADSEKEIEPGENPNKYLVHNSDILAVLNELKTAGAEAIAINGIRYTSRSTVDCGGAVINVDGEISAHPFVIEAIGDPEAMFIYLNSDESVVKLLKYWEIKVNIEKSEQLKLNKSNHLS